MKTQAALLLALTAFSVGVLTGAAGPARQGGVVSIDTAPTRVAPSGTARIRMMSKPGAQAFVGVLELDAGARVPVHRDVSDELLYVLEGGGTLHLDGKTHTIKPGDVVTMPGGAEVRFEGNADGPTKVVQVFAPGESAAKYESWPVAQSANP